MQENLQVKDIRKTDMVTSTDVVTGEVQVKEEHRDSRAVVLSRGEGLPEVLKTTRGDQFQPTHLTIKWVRRNGKWDGFGTDAEAFGWRLKKNGQPGERPGKAYWLPQYPNHRADTPDWVLKLYDEYHPETGSHPFTYAVTKKPNDEVDP